MKNTQLTDAENIIPIEEARWVVTECADETIRLQTQGVELSDGKYAGSLKLNTGDREFLRTHSSTRDGLLRILDLFESQKVEMPEEFYQLIGNVAESEAGVIGSEISESRADLDLVTRDLEERSARTLPEREQIVRDAAVMGDNVLLEASKQAEAAQRDFEDEVVTGIKSGEIAPDAWEQEKRAMKQLTVERTDDFVLRLPDGNEAAAEIAEPVKSSRSRIWDVFTAPFSKN